MFIEIKEHKIKFETESSNYYLNNDKTFNFPNPLYFEAYNVEFGACSSIYNKKSFTLIDAGTIFDPASLKIKNTVDFIANKIKSFDYQDIDFVLTHFHKDHYSLIVDILNFANANLRYLFIYNPFHKKFIFYLSLINLIFSIVNNNNREEALYLLLRFFGDATLKKLTLQKRITKIYFVKERSKFYLNKRIFYALDNDCDDFNLIKDEDFKDSICLDFDNFLEEFSYIPLFKKILELIDEYLDIYKADGNITSDSIEIINENTPQDDKKVEFFFNDKIDIIVGLLNDAEDDVNITNIILESKFYERYIKKVKSIKRYIK